MTSPVRITTGGVITDRELPMAVITEFTALRDSVGVRVGAGAYPHGESHLIDDTTPDPSVWAGADDEGLGGYQR